MISSAMAKLTTANESSSGMLPNKGVEAPAILPGSSMPSACTMTSFTSSSVDVAKSIMLFHHLERVDLTSHGNLVALDENLQRNWVPQECGGARRQAVGACLKDCHEVTDFCARKHDVVAQDIERRAKASDDRDVLQSRSPAFCLRQRSDSFGE